jgi:pimeloyl-ACP methyl ester carboxylesterase
MTKDLIIIVPGIMGSVLKRGRISVWDTSTSTAARSLIRFGELAEALRLPRDLGDAEPGGRHALEATGLVGGWHIWPGVWVGPGYHGLETKLRAWYPEPYQVRSFAYDWRLSNRATAARLKIFAEAALGRWQSTSGNSEARIVFVSHSMGGLVVRYYVNRLGGHEVCRRIITIGTPFSGSVKAVRALAGDIPGCTDRLVETMRSFPSLHQLLPSFRCTRTAHGTSRLTEAPVPGIESRMAADAQQLHTESVGRPGGPPVHAFAGRFQTTLAGVEVIGGAVKYYSTWPETGTGGRLEIDHGGDSTVPSFAATPTEFADDTGTEFHGDRHGSLPNRSGLLKSLHRKIENLSPAAFLDPGFEFGIDLPDVSPAALMRVRVNASATDLDFRMTVTDLRGRVAIQGMALNPEGDNGYAAELQLPRGVWHVEISLAGHPETAVADLVVVD